MSSLKGQVAIVTGASRGLGRATARALAREGAQVVLTARTAEQLITLADELKQQGLQSLVIPADISDETQINSLIKRTLDQFGQIDVLINNAAINRAKPFEQLTTADLDAVIDVNLRGVILCAHAAYQQMVSQKSGTIVNVGSVMSHRVVPQNTVYCASKYAVLGFSRALMLEGKNHNVRVIAFMPGGMATSWYDDRPDFDTSRMMQAESVAGVMVQLLNAPPDAVPYELIIAPNGGASWP